MGTFEELFKTLPKPIMVTIARSALDEYCPSDKVDFLEQRVTEILMNTYSVKVIKHENE